MASANEQPPDEDHYTAYISVTRSKTVAQNAAPRLGTERVRKVNDVTKIVVRATTLEKLVAKTTAHLALVEEL